MLTILLLQLLLSCLTLTEGAPFNNAEPRGVEFSSTAPFPVIRYIYTKDYRSVWSIIWSCVSVVFACTWTAVHPNVYGYRSTQWQRIKTRTVLFLLALLLPEVPLLWSIKQWRGAREITKRMRVEKPRLEEEQKERREGPETEASHEATGTDRDEDDPSGSIGGES